MSQADEGGLVGVANPPEGSDQDAKTTPLIGGVVGPEGLPEAALSGVTEAKSPRRVFTQGTMLMLMVCVIAAGTLYAMRLSQRSVRPSEETKDIEAKIDMALAKLSAPEAVAKIDPLRPDNVRKPLDETEDVVSMLSADVTGRQVPPRFVQKNPFVLPEFRPVAVPQSEQDDALEQARRDRLTKLERELDQFELQSVMRGSRPVAVISGQLVQTGHGVGSFTVKKIHDMSVDLECDGHVLSLRIADQRDHDQRDRRRGQLRGRVSKRR